MRHPSEWPERLRLKPHPSKHKYLLQLVHGAGTIQLANDILHLAEIGAMFKLGLLSTGTDAIAKGGEASETNPHRVAAATDTHGERTSGDALGGEMKDVLLSALHAAPTLAPNAPREP